MMYSQTVVLDPLSRTINIFPSSYAVFNVNCLCPNCLDGGFDFTKIINTLVRTRKEGSKGKIGCKRCSTPEYSDVVYTVMIKYAE